MTINLALSMAICAIIHRAEAQIDSNANSRRAMKEFTETSFKYIEEKIADLVQSIELYQERERRRMIQTTFDFG